MMKKTIISMCAVLTAAAFTACSNEVDMFQPIGTGSATIDLNVSNNDEISVGTRAEGDKTVTDLASWTAVVTKEESSETIKASEVGSKKFQANDEVTVKVSNYASLAAAMPESEAGDAYYEGSATKQLSKGANEMTIECGKAKNCRVKATWTNTTDLTITGISTTQSGENTSRSYAFSESGKTAYYYADAEISYTVNYTFKSVTKTVTKTISTPAAATEYGLNVVSNENGSITLTVTYNDEFAAGGTTTTTIDAVTGEEAE